MDSCNSFKCTQLLWMTMELPGFPNDIVDMEAIHANKAHMLQGCCRVLMNILSGCCKPDVGIMRDLVGSRAQPEAQGAEGGKRGSIDAAVEASRPS